MRKWNLRYHHNYYTNRQYIIIDITDICNIRNIICNIACKRNIICPKRISNMNMRSSSIRLFGRNRILWNIYTQSAFNFRNNPPSCLADNRWKYLRETVYLSGFILALKVFQKSSANISSAISLWQSQQSGVNRITWKQIFWEYNLCDNFIAALTMVEFRRTRK